MTNLSLDQIQAIIDSEDDHKRQYFVWQMDPDNTDIETFFNDEVLDTLSDDAVALMQHLDSEDYDECVDLIASRDYLVLTYYEAHTKAWEYAEDYCNDSVLSQIPEHLHYYFDSERWIEDYINEGLGPILASCDGEEHEEDVNDTTYYIYKCC